MTGCTDIKKSLNTLRILFDELKKLQDKDIINITPDIIQKITTLSCFNYIGSF